MQHASSLLLSVLLVTVLLGTGCSSGDDALPPAAADNPLPECPASPNCERISKRYASPPDQLYDHVLTALDTLGPVRLQTTPDSLRASAVYRVALVFKDDVDVAVTEESNGSRLHVRSASRTGYSDLGVNRRRVQRLLSAVNDVGSPPSSTR